MPSRVLFCEESPVASTLLLPLITRTPSWPHSETATSLSIALSALLRRMQSLEVLRTVTLVNVEPLRTSRPTSAYSITALVSEDGVEPVMVMRSQPPDIFAAISCPENTTGSEGVPLTINSPSISKP